MASPTYDTLRYLRGWVLGSSGTPMRGVVAGDIAVGAGPEAIAARRYRPASRNRPLPGWLLLHGVTRPGPDHPSIVRFAAALAGAGGDVLVPDIPAWRRLELDPAPAQSALERGLEYLHNDPLVRTGGVIVAGLSFGVPQALRVARRLAAGGRVRGVVGFGGYCRLFGAIRFGLTGQFEWRSRTAYLRPDPYGRWVVAANYLHRIPGYASARGVSRALGRLASLAGDRRIMSWDPGYDGVKDELTSSMPAEDRALFRLFAPPADREPEPGPANEIAPLLAEAARSVHPDLELPRSSAPGDRPAFPVRLIHGRRDHLIPFTETLALERRLGSRTDVSATVTDLFAHSAGSAANPARLREAVRFFMALRGIMGLRPH